ncbi:hypothetical protein J8L98_22070 [Pseudoalteromonas sp. MMG013]|uniref:hypothetical protein n=1 Tax=Pseudoalteromonas sp. MMG013 TaxID=2822687 RepID=UPI001B3810F8|nr:hypothetical protein [Pseudoalteromonas sp. MMG013]MBQ4864382.1 hypothetical protein [Pseudoalteromonas sp. MMG013]
MKNPDKEPIKPKLTPTQIAEQARAALSEHAALEKTERQSLAGAFTLDDNTLISGGK